MPRYVSLRPRAEDRRFWAEDDAQPTDWDGKGQSIEAVAAGDDYEMTGILDADGNEIARFIRAPLGFDLSRR